MFWTTVSSRNWGFSSLQEATFDVWDYSHTGSNIWQLVKLYVFVARFFDVLDYSQFPQLGLICPARSINWDVCSHLVPHITDYLAGALLRLIRRIAATEIAIGVIEKEICYMSPTP